MTITSATTDHEDRAIMPRRYERKTNVHGWIRVHIAAAILDVHRSTVHEMLKDGRLRGTADEPRGHLRFIDPESVAELAMANGTDAHTLARRFRSLGLDPVKAFGYSLDTPDLFDRPK